MSKLLKMLMIALLVVSCSKQDEKTAGDEVNLTVVSADGTRSEFVVENAVTLEELQLGLMNRDSLPAAHGMIFNLKGYPKAAMWMKDTKIPWDMVFINDGKVVWTFENAKPLSTDTILSPVPANAVLEINAGEVKKYNIKPGDKIEHAFFDNSNPVVLEALPEEDAAALPTEAGKKLQPAAVE